MKSNDEKLLEILSNHDVTFTIPPYQRNYEWTEEQCSVFYDDILRVCNVNMNANGVTSEKTEYFFGTIIYSQPEPIFGQPNKLVLIDGQQRITTTMLFLCALKDVTDDADIKEHITTQYLKNEKVKDDSEYKIKLKQVESDWSTYKRILLGEFLFDEDKKSRIYASYKFFLNKIAQYCDKGGNPNDLVTYGLSKFNIITLELQPTRNKWENPQEIFESMNSLSVPLSLADFVRNYLLMGYDADLQEEYYRKYWLPIESLLPGELSNYIRDYMQWKLGESIKKATETNYKLLYSLFKANSEKWGASREDILKNLFDNAELYSYIVLGRSTGNDKIDEILTDIKYFRITTAYSFLLALFSERKSGRINDDDMVEILDVFRIYCLRRRLVNLHMAENKDFPKLVNRIDEIEASNNKREKMFDILSTLEYNLRLPNDNEIKNQLRDMNFFNYGYCKTFLVLIEKAMTKNRPDLDDKNLQTEHIMPQTLTADWEKALGDDVQLHNQYVHNIGNLTLIRHNQELGQKTFSEKKNVYQNNAGLQIAKTKILDKDEWNVDAIKDRCEWISDYFVNNVFPVPESLKMSNNFSS